MKKIGAAKFKQQCLALLDHLDPEGLVITKRGKPVARVLPIARKPSEVIGCMKGKIKGRGNVFSTGIRWDAES